MFLLTVIQNMTTTQFLKDAQSTPYLNFNMSALVSATVPVLTTHKYEITYVLSMGLVVFLLLLQQLQNHRLSLETLSIRKRLYHMNLAQTKTKTTTDFEKEVKTLLLCLVNRSDVVKRNFDLVLQELNTLQTNSLNQSSVIEKLLKTRTCSMDCTSETKTGETKPYPESESDSDYEDEPVPKRIVINRPNKYGKNYKEESDSDDETYVEN